VKRKIRPYSARKTLSISRFGALVIFALIVLLVGSALAVQNYFTPGMSNEKVAAPAESSTPAPGADMPLSEPAVTEPIGTPLVSNPGVVPNPGTSTLVNPLLGTEFFINKDSSVFRALEQTSDPTQIQKLNKISAQPIATWVVGSTDLTKLSTSLSGALQQNTTPIIVLYNIPKLGCSNGGAPSLAAYKEWVDGVVGSIASTKPVVVLEPDAVPLAGCLKHFLTR
jgi:endoglucanase